MEEKSWMNGVISRINKAVRELAICSMPQSSRRVQASHPRSTTTTTTKQWQPPEVGWVKINSNGAALQKNGQAGIGVVARDHTASLITGIGKTVYTSEALCAEALAIKEGVNLCIEQGFPRVILETDSEAVYDSLSRKRCEEKWTIKPVLDDVRNMRLLIPDSRIFVCE